MKSCPICSRTFEDTMTFCLIDGSVLSAPFDPQATVRSLEAAETDRALTEVVTRVGLPHNAGFQPPTAVYNQSLPTPPAATEQKPLTVLQVIGMWAQLVLAIIISLVLSVATGYIVAAFVTIVFRPSKSKVIAALFIPIFLTFAILMIFTVRWWRRKRRRAGLV